jgi:leader peptidase (prepilin peptidase) / N-methyltransferase
VLEPSFFFSGIQHIGGGNFLSITPPVPFNVFIALTFIFGLMIGSFLNVVIYRLPKMLERSWKTEALWFLHESYPSFLSAQGSKEATLPPAEPFNLALPHSHCGHCGHAIKWYENIPLLSWCIQRARCTACKGKISLRYPLIECLTAITSAYIAQRYGWSLTTLGCLILNAMLICAFWIDWDTQLLPDSITLPLLWIGLFLSYINNGLVPFSESFWGCIAGYGLLWSVYWLFLLLFKKEGMGYGDFKLLAAFGAWMGYSVLPSIILLASLSGLAYALLRSLTGFSSPSEKKIVTENSQEYQWSKPLPFGPFLIIGGWIVWFILTK